MVSSESKERPRIPTTGMRGGLGRTLLTAFLVLTIVPLSAVAWYATRRERNDIQGAVTAKLSSVATMMEGRIHQWAEGHTEDLALLATLPTASKSIALTSDSTLSDPARDELRAQMRVVMEHKPAIHRLALLNQEGRVLVSAGQPGDVEDVLLDGEEFSFQFLTFDPSADVGAIAAHRVAGSEGENAGQLVGWLDLNGLISDLESASPLGEDGEVYLVDANGIALPQGKVVDSEGIKAALEDGEAKGLYENYAGKPVVGVYRRLPDLGVALVAEQSQEQSFAATDTVTAAIVGATLLVALATAIIAAVVTRQITRPVVQLTEAALNIAEGDLERRVPVEKFSRDEVGILAHVFNRMATELESLYNDLEAKVVERTRLLQKANYQAQQRAIQLAATVEVGQAVSSILEPGQLLHKVVRVVHDRFDYSYVGIYLLDDDGERALLREGTGGGETVMAYKREPVPVEEGSPVGEAALTGEPCITRWDADQAREMFSSPYIRAEAALPLGRGGEIIGVLDILDTKMTDFNADEVSALQNVANQITVALENARIYRKEKETARRLRETEEFRSRFLAHMSHELREPLTNIIGFSRLVLKGLDGPINDQQRKDLRIIHANSQHLLGLINDLLDISQIEAGLMELHFRELDLSRIIESVMSTTSALVRDKDIELRKTIDADLPQVRADEDRIRQVLLRLLRNAAKFTDQGSISVRAWSSDHEVLVSVSDTGRGIASEEQERIFEQFKQGTLENGRRPDGAGLGLALSKEFVELHGGEIWVESELGEGSTFTFSLPLQPVDSAGGGEDDSEG